MGGNADLGPEGPWAIRVREECEAVRDLVGVLDLPGFSRFELSGNGAGDWLLGLIAGALPKVGRMALAYFPDHRGRILTEMSVINHGQDRFTLITAGVAQWHDGEWLRKHLAPGLALEDRSDQIGTLIVTGPKARALFAAISDGDLSLPWLSVQIGPCGRPSRDAGARLFRGRAWLGNPCRAGGYPFDLRGRARTGGEALRHVGAGSPAD